MKELPIAEELLTCEEAAKYLRMTVRTLRRYIAREAIPYIRLPSGTIRFRRSDLDKWLKKWGKNI